MSCLFIWSVLADILGCPAGAQQPERHKDAIMHLAELLQQHQVLPLTEQPPWIYTKTPQFLGCSLSLSECVTLHIKNH